MLQTTIKKYNKNETKIKLFKPQLKQSYVHSRELAWKDMIMINIEKVLAILK